MPVPGTPPPCVLSRLFLNQVARRPQATALKTLKEEITYSQLHSRAVAIKDALAKQDPKNKTPEGRDDQKPHLNTEVESRLNTDVESRLNPGVESCLNTGVESRPKNTGVVVIFCGKTQAAEICAVLGIVLSGGCFVPVDERLPAPRLREVMEDVQPCAIIASRMMSSPPSRPSAWGGFARGGPGRPVGAVIESWRQRGCLVLNLEESGQLSEALEKVPASEPLGEVSAPERQAQAQQQGCAQGSDEGSILHHHRDGGQTRPQFVESAASPAATTVVDAPSGVDGGGRVSGVPRPRVAGSTDGVQRAGEGGVSPILVPSAVRQDWSRRPKSNSGRRGVANGDVPADTETDLFDPPRGEGDADGALGTSTETDVFDTPPHHEEDGDLLYIVYTSGTTGVPKGVKGTRSGAVNRIRFGWDLCPFREEGELVSRRTPSCFVDFVAEVFCPLLAGVPLFLAPDGAHADPLLLVPALVEAKVTRITLTPSLLASLLRTAGSYASPLLPDLHTWLVSGEALHPELALLFRHLTAPGTQLINLYGSTEVSGDATYCTLDEIVQSGSTTGVVYGGVLIGKPLPGVHLSVVGPDLLPVPVGQPGELLVGGVGVALGYHCRPQEAATRFLRSAARGCGRELDSGVYIAGLEPGRGVFRTGDRVVRSMAGGPFFWLGKLDGEVKVRGVRVSLEEVEILACRATGLPSGAFSVVYDPGRRIAASEVSVGGPTHDGVAAAVATNDPDRVRLLGFFAPKGAPDTTDGLVEMKRQMATEMTAAQLPAVLLPVLGGFPLAATGKVDKKSLLSEYRRSAESFPEDRFPPTASDTGTPAFSPRHFTSGTSQTVQGLASARVAIARAIVTVLPDARAAFLPWMIENSAVDRQESRDLSHLTFDGVGGTSLLAVEAAWLASRSVAWKGAESTLLAPASLLAAEDFLRGTLEGAAVTLTATLQAKRDAAEVEVGASPEPAKGKGSAEKESSIARPPESLGPPVNSAPLLPAVQATASPASVQAPRVGRKRRLQAGKGYQEEKPRGFLAIGRGGVGSRRTQACLGETADSKGGVLVSRVELRVRWSSCLTKCIDASPLVVVPVAASRTVGSAKRERLVEVDGLTHGARVESTACKKSVYGSDSSLGCVRSDLLRGTIAGEAGAGKPSLDRVPLEASGLGGQGVQGEGGGRAGGSVYIGSHSGEFQALNLATGERKWSFTAGGRIESGAACSFDGSTVFVGCHDRRLYALDRRTGALSWSFETGDAIKCTPVCVNLEPFFDGHEDAAENNGLPTTLRAVLVGSHDGFLRCLSQAHGSLLWGLDCGGALFASPAHDANACVIYAATTKGHVFAVEGAAWASLGAGAEPAAARADVKQGANGEVAREPVVIWKRQLPAPCFSTPAVCKGTGDLVLGCVDGGLYCLSSMGEQLWVCRRGEKPVFSSPCILPCLWEDGGGDKEAGRRVVWGSHDGNVRCGWGQDLAWETDIDKGRPVFSSPCFAEVACERCTLLCPLVFACSVPGLICTSNLSDGVVVGEKQLPGEVFSSAVVTGQTLVVGCRDNRVYVLDILASCAECAKAS